ncbi:MAG: GatB/YqeY domain-containing protein [Clostridia bacterium]|nr:GatB/YqeY domain-containing protein [Clostridia bacterium]
MILEQINKANVQAFKEKNTLVKDIISIIKSKAKLLEVEKRTKGEQITDADMASLIQKLIKELAEAQENYKKVNNVAEIETIEKQIEFCKTFLPKTLSKEEIKNIILSLDDKTVPFVMKHFKTNFAGAVDMREVQEVLKSI